MVRRLPQQAGTGFLGEGPRPRTCGSIGHAALAYREGGRGLPLAVAIGCGECGLFLLAESGESFSKSITRTGTHRFPGASLSPTFAFVV